LNSLINAFRPQRIVVKFSDSASVAQIDKFSFKRVETMKLLIDWGYIALLGFKELPFS